ncbi:hypothetical protein SAMN05192534_11912 [Alteribacillus persepolensis]|uniref:Uncharacterized protein n=1 Tax=Alteribacillus persepolensis TaxID=568899 RepID=A0A1G8H9E0_9BACI|nr:hypothetical protein [Alteribacillus persepolensis]SDI03288.1 hypothetical protein SAMN05192534_11912 [Alteribacillus persepolensis]
MKASFIGAVLFVIVTAIGSVLGSTNPDPADVIAPIVSSILSIVLYFGFMKWEDKLTKS